MSTSGPESPGQPARCLGLDVGERRIGLSSSRSWLASPLPTMEVDGTEDGLRRIAQLLREEDYDIVVYGMPYDAEGRTGPQAEKIRGFIARLEELVPDREYVAWNEGLTSWQAERTVAGSVKKKNRKRVVDRVAALLILQGYLDSKQRRLI